MDIGALRMAQQDGGAPTTLAAGSAPGESGVSVLNFRFDGGMHLLATPRCHCICFEMSQVRVEKRMAGRIAHYERPVGSLTINPAGYDFAADADEDVEILVVAVDPGRMALAAAEGALPEAQLIERLGGEDPALFALARTLAFENVHNYPSGALSWNEAASSFVDGLVGGHTMAMPARSRGMLGKDQLRRLRDYVAAHLDEPIGVEALADLAGRSPFHFTRVFTRSVGMTPHRYVVHLRLQRAIELVREGRSGLAEIAARTGFADQSHLSRWVRRVHGVPLSRVTA
ncbi:MAG TPA: AraC family transcriptional regulator [Xanthobacteraceae bacterium]